MKYPLSLNTWNEKEKKAIINILKSNQFTMSNKVLEFEKKFARKFKSKFAIMVNSGSSANLLMFTVLKYLKKIQKKKNIKKPNIIVPSIGWSTSYFPISQNGFEINFVDINLKTLNIDVDKLKKCIDKNTIAIMAINLLGNPCNLKVLRDICFTNKLILIEDNCESLCAKYKDKFSGTYGMMSSHSLFFSHHMQTMEGGVILTQSRIINDFLRSLRAHGWARDLNKKNSLYKFKNDNFIDKFKFLTPGYCLRPLEMSAAAGLIQLKKLNNFMKIRLNNSKIFKNLFKNKDWCQIQVEEELAQSSWFGFNIILKGILKGKRKKIIKILLKNGIEVRPTMTGNFTKNPVIKYLPHKIRYNLINSDYVDKNGFFFGNYPKNLKKELELTYKIISSEVIKNK
jgi:CDP-4-dehydro-6-deoxyglucose reductase, E1